MTQMKAYMLVTRCQRFVQVLGLFTVTATTLGTLYLIDTEDVASPQGLNALGVLLLILNASFVIIMASLILLAARQSIRRCGEWVLDKAQRAGFRVAGRPRITRQWSRLSKAASGDNAASPGSHTMARSASSPTQQLALFADPSPTSPAV